MQKLIGLVRRCVEDYKMIEDGDRIAVGVSGGKDSVALLVFLAELVLVFKLLLEQSLVNKMAINFF